MASEMVERVKQAIKARRAIAEWPHLSDSEIDQICEAQAKAAIEAMREPTNAMRKVCSFETAEIEYPAMIDEALAE
jgi:hypothetical protein